MDTIGICLATYNGAQFLQEQLDSIAAQRFQSWHLWVRDDASTDQTGHILRVFSRRYPERITHIHDDLGQLGPRDNFGHLMAFADTPYIAFADQDDVWHPDKLGREMVEMRRLEALHGAEHPVMVHADRRLINGHGAEITASYWSSRRCDAAAFGLDTCLAFCLAAGSTMLINRALVQRALPIPSAARMHDSWIELVAHGVGAVSALDNIVLDHRRHCSNASGAHRDIDSAEARRLWARAGRLLRGLDQQRHIYTLYFAQAAAFQSRFGAELSSEAAQRLTAFLALPQRRLVARLAQLALSRMGPPGLARCVALAALSGDRSPRNSRHTDAPA